jgi:aspartyl-tRNA(Asn)/glutamyl-tRNA(Gln) amidotransferase subunit C
MSYDESHVKKIAQLAKIYLTPEHATKLGADIEMVMEKFNDLNKYNTDNVEPLVSNTVGYTPLREDKVAGQDMVKVMLSNAPEKDASGEFFTVPKVIES